MFGRMFPKLPPLAIDDAPLKELAAAMKDADPGSAAAVAANVPAGFTLSRGNSSITTSRSIYTLIREKNADPNGVGKLPDAGARSRLHLGLGPDGNPPTLCAQSA